MFQKSSLIRLLTKQVQSGYTFGCIRREIADILEIGGFGIMAKVFLRYRKKAKAKILARLIDDMSLLYVLDCGAPGKIELSPLCGLPILDRLAKTFIHNIHTLYLHTP